MLLCCLICFLQFNNSQFNSQGLFISMFRIGRYQRLLMVSNSDQHLSTISSGYQQRFQKVYNGWSPFTSGYKCQAQQLLVSNIQEWVGAARDYHMLSKCLNEQTLIVDKMHRHFKLKSMESSMPSSFRSENSLLNENSPTCATYIL